MSKTIKSKIVPRIRANKKIPNKSTGKKRLAKVQNYDPVKISERIAPVDNHFIIYPTISGYRFTMFYRDEDADPFEIIGVSQKAYKLKTDCIVAMKKLLYGFGDSLKSRYIHAYTHKGEEISLEIKYDVKKLW